jgi:hypothetical protein
MLLLVTAALGCGNQTPITNYQGETMSDPFSTMGHAGAAPVSVSELSAPLATARGWMKFVGIMFIIQGAFTALTIVGIIVAWLPIWIGVLLLQSSTALERAFVADDASALKESLAKLRTYFIIQGVMYLVGMVIMVLYFVFFAAVIGTMLKNGTFPPH